MVWLSLLGFSLAIAPEMQFVFESSDLICINYDWTIPTRQKYFDSLTSILMTVKKKPTARWANFLPYWQIGRIKICDFTGFLQVFYQNTRWLSKSCHAKAFMCLFFHFACEVPALLTSFCSAKVMHWSALSFYLIVGILPNRIERPFKTNVYCARVLRVIFELKL